MHGEPSIRDDSTLLARWALEGSEDAFAKLVENYQRLVLGAALRRTGDADLARDVAQQVFTTLAMKARLLLGRTNIAGWLYQAASHIAARTAQAEFRRRVAHGNFANAGAQGETVSAQEWPHVEEALGGLGAAERESLVLHYFQDLSYPEMAGTLRIEEATARKRVSRALQSLEVQLRRRGVRSSAAVVLSAAVAQQSITPAQAGLASAALSAAATAPLSVTLTTLMSQTTVKLAVCAAALIVTPLALEWKANASLRTEIAKIRSADPQLAALRTDADSIARRKTELQAALAAQHTARLAAENRVADLTALKAKIETEVVVSFGSVDSMAKKLARAMRILDSLEKAKPGSEEHRQAVAQAQQMAEGMQELIGMLQEIPRLERHPAKAARFYATCYGEVADLDDPARTLLEERARQWLQDLQGEGLALPQRPKGKAKEWDTRRNAAMKQFFAKVAAELPPPKEGRAKLEDAFRFTMGDEDGPINYEMMVGGGQQ